MAGKNNKPSTTFNGKSAYTNRGCAYARAKFTDIPFAKEMYEIMLARGEGASEENITGLNNAGIIPYFEARYKLISGFLKKSGIAQVLEIASGMSPRGLGFALEGYTYVEMDLPAESSTKKEIVEELCRQQAIVLSMGLFFEGGNAISGDDFLRACTHFDRSKPIAVICEGFLRYVSFDDKDLFFGNVHDLLLESGGMMATPDIELLSDNPNGNKSHEHMKEKTGIDTRENLFRDIHHALSYCYEKGFKAKHYFPTDVIRQLVSPGRLGLSLQEVEANLEKRHALVLTLRNQ